MYIKVGREKKHVNNFLCELCCSFIVKKHPCLVWSKTLNWWRGFSNVYRFCCQRCPKLYKGMQTTHLTCTSPIVWKKVVLYGKTVVKLHLTFRVINCGLLKLNSYSWYSCTLVVLKNQCLIYYGYPFFDNAFFSYHFVYIDNVLFCVSNISLVTPTSIEYANFFAHA